MKDHITKEQFLLEFFGPLGRELGDPAQHYVDNPSEIFAFIEKCTREKKPAFISVQPRTAHKKIYGIEKIFYDFDYGKKSDKFTDVQIARHRIKMEREVRIFLHNLTKSSILPLVVRTRKGYHVYVYFNRIYQISSDEQFWREVYSTIFNRFLKNNRHEYKYADTTSMEDIFRLCRIPTSIHQKDGSVCIVLDSKLRPTKLRSIEYYKMYGLKRDDLQQAIEVTRINRAKKKIMLEKLKKDRKENWEMKHGFVGEIRLCFLEAIKKRKEMSHKQRLALLLEAWYCGIKTEDELVDLFRDFNDFKESKTRYQVRWFLSHEIYKVMKPYTCRKMLEENWCLKDDCPMYVKRKKYAKTKRKKA